MCIEHLHRAYLSTQDLSIEDLQMLEYLQKTPRESSVNRKSLDINLYIKDLQRIFGLQGVLRHRRLLNCILSEDHQRDSLCKKTPRLSHVYRSLLSLKTAFSLKKLEVIQFIENIQRIFRVHKSSSLRLQATSILVYRITTSFFLKKTFTVFSTHRRIIESPLSIEFLQRILYPEDLLSIDNPIIRLTNNY